MKKVLLSVYIILSAGLLAANAQCVPDTSIHTSGVYPDSAVGLASGMVNVPYNQVMQVRVPVDTIKIVFGSPVTVPIVSVAITSFTGLPPGLTYTCTPSNCTFPGGSNGCVLIAGTPTTAGTFYPVATTTTTGTIFGAPLTQVDSINYYHITIAQSNVGIAENSSHTFAVNQNIPNPVNDISMIRFFNPTHTTVIFKMYNILGKEIMNKNIDAAIGENDFKFDGRDFVPGIYLYTMTSGTTTISKRMVISKK